MNILCMKRMLYYWRSSFSGLELYASYEWRATAPNMHHGLFLICHFVCISSITRKPWCTCNSTTHQTTPLLPRMLCFKLKAVKQLQPTSYAPCKHRCLFILCTSTNDNKTQGVDDCIMYRLTHGFWGVTGNTLGDR